jgi:AcrR family transcriptional regulator
MSRARAGRGGADAGAGASASASAGAGAGAGADSPSPPIWVQSPPPSRRRALGRDEIVRAAIEVADAGGTEALTMAAVARKLGSFTPMSLYRYVYSKDGLIDLMLDAVNGEVEVPDHPSGDWRADLHSVALSAWGAMKRHPWAAQLVHSRPPVGPNALRRTEFMLATFTGLGQPPGMAMGYASLVERLVIGMAVQAAEERDPRRHADFSTPETTELALEPLRDLVAASGAYPNLARWVAAPSGPDADEQFELGLDCLLDGIGTRVEPS